MTTTQKLIQPKLGLLKLAEKLGNVSDARKLMGYSIDSFYRFQKLYDEGGEFELIEISRSKPLLKNRIEKEIEDVAVAYAIESPAFGQQLASNELRKRRIIVAPFTIRCVWVRHALKMFQKRLKALVFETMTYFPPCLAYSMKTSVSRSALLALFQSH
ncbi:helix-turn-helix domain-containing protein [Dyadobacter chenhuakuii]|uniref:Helix-turn-helix domain-containing protein n=1 Tax=Dyadobacter chenhuakuii TaxID=2909339 RepID=A0ABY4XGU6_9BACT|nr:helix-turn-helix domain-containing protein [Dyadobacter chenhuakuii]MCF2495612.1 helix-turn-helix domain-containing protein [Dyadobacter chenhuakuii]USJ29646.1 helix-turn-helix domain-containing protein [Dyadobacter chenhuakuii]